MPFTQLEGKFYYCSKQGHTSFDCRNNGKFQDKTIKYTSTTMPTSDKEQHVGRAGMYHAFTQYDNLKYMVLLDNNSSDTIICNPKYIKNKTSEKHFKARYKWMTNMIYHILV